MPVSFLSISQAEATKIISAIVAKAGSDGGSPVAVSVVDHAGRLIAFAAMDSVMPACIKLSQSKAYSAVIGCRDTQEWATKKKNDAFVDFDMRNWSDENFTGFTGGVVIHYQQQIVGGIGVSGRRGAMDAGDVLMQDNELATYGRTIFNLLNSNMNTKTLPGTDIQLSPITYGAFAIGGWFWGGADEGDAIKAIETALDNGITTIDTAPVYGMGHSESVVGKTVYGKRSKVQILTKFGMRWDTTSGDFAFDTKDNDGTPVKVYKFNGKQSVIEECERSLKHLQTDYIDLLQMHWPDSTTPIEETMEALLKLKEQGKIRAAGVCNCPVDLLKKANTVVPIATNQVPYSMVNRSIEKEMVPYCLDAGIGILPHTSLQKGLLTGKIKPGHQFGEGDHRPSTPYFKEQAHNEVMKMLGAIQPIADERGISLAQLAINWTMQQPAITSVLVGARNSEQMLDNVKATSFTLTEEELSQIDSALNEINIQL